MIWTLLFFSSAFLASELWLMRVFSVSSWAHFGSMVIGIAMLSLGFSSVLLNLAPSFFERHRSYFKKLSLFSYGPLLLLCHACAQKISFNALLLLSDPAQKYNLLILFLLYFIPFFFASLFIGIVFSEYRKEFAKMYFADLVGAGIGGALFLAALHFLATPQLHLLILALWLIALASFLFVENNKVLFSLAFLSLAFSLFVSMHAVMLKISPYKGVSYAKNFPDSKIVYQNQGPEGWLQIFESSYFHFAPGLSDAAFTLKKMPQNAFLGAYFDGEGPVGLMRHLSEDEKAYFDFLPLSLPYKILKEPKVLVLQMGGGIATQVALKHDAQKIVVTEPGRLLISALKNNSFLADFTGHFLENKKINLIEKDGRIFLLENEESFDLIDLSFADSTGLSMAGGTSIREKYLYTVENFNEIIQDLSEQGIFALTIWNKEDPPKASLKVLKSLIQAAKKWDSQHLDEHFFVSQSYLSTLNILYKKSGFTAQEIESLKKRTQELSFEVLYSPDLKLPDQNNSAVLQAYRDVYFNSDQMNENLNLSLGNFYQLALQDELKNPHPQFLNSYIFDTKALSYDQPYLAAFVKKADLLHFLKNLNLVSDEWGYLLLWLSLAVAASLALLLLIIPLIFNTKKIFHSFPNFTARTFYFMCLGLAYIWIELAFMSEFQFILDYPAFSSSVLVTSLLIFSGVGSLFSIKLIKNKKDFYLYLSLLAFLLIAWSSFGHQIMLSLAHFSFIFKLLLCIALIAPIAFLMGLPFSVGVAQLETDEDSSGIVWAWGVNGCFSVLASLSAPLIAVNAGQALVIRLAALLYLACTLSYAALQKK